MERLAILAPREVIDTALVEAELSGDLSGPDVGQGLRGIVEQCERDAIARAVQGSQGNVAEAARRLGLERAHLYKKARSLGMKLREL